MSSAFPSPGHHPTLPQGDGLRVMVTSEVESVQVPLWIVQRKTFAPKPRAVTPEFGLLGVVIVALPLTSVHVPVPTVGLLPARVAVLVSQKAWSVPAAAVVGVRSRVMVTSLVESEQVPL